MSFPRYPKYKDSCVEWLGEVPEQWPILPMKAVAKEVYEPNRGMRETNLLSLSYGRIVRKNIETSEGLLPESFETYQIVRPGEIIFRPTDLQNDWTSLRTAIVEERGIITSAYIAVASCSPLPRYLNYLYRAYDHQKVFYSMGGGLRQSLKFSDLKNLPMLVPSEAEQTAIAGFLDRETAKIDGLVGEQRRLIELLKEKRQAVISHAVTKGLNPQAPLKPSGIQWLGNIPEHWEVMRIAKLFRESVEVGNSQLPILRVSIHDGVSDKEIPDDELNRKVNRSEDRTKYKRVSPGDLVYNMMRAWQGGFGSVVVKGMVSPAYVVARPRTSVLTTYVEHLLRTPQAVEQIRRYSRGITDFRLRLYWDEFKNLRIPVPPQPEAIAICESVRAMDANFDALTAETKRAIELLQERRTALISAAVTGKIDIRSLGMVDGAERDEIVLAL